jgi:hypothetical protein
MRQKALDLLSRFSYINGPVKITKRCRPLGGQVVTLRDLFWHKEEPWGVVQLQSGTRTAIPLSWTDLPKDAFPTRMSAPQIDALRLLEMSRFLQQVNTKTTKSTKRKPQRKSTRAK